MGGQRQQVPAQSAASEATRESNDTSLSVSSDAMHSNEEHAALSFDSRGQAAVGLPSSCASCFLLAWRHVQQPGLA